MVQRQPLGYRSLPHAVRSRFFVYPTAHTLCLAGSRPLSSRPHRSLPPTLSSSARSSNVSDSSTVALAPCLVRPLSLPEIPRRFNANAVHTRYDHFLLLRHNRARHPSCRGRQSIHRPTDRERRSRSRTFNTIHDIAPFAHCPASRRAATSCLAVSCFNSVSRHLPSIPPDF